MKRWFIVPLFFLLMFCMGNMVYLPHRRAAYTAFDPTDVPNMAWWYKADEIAGKSNGDLVTNWADFGPNNWTASETGAATQPYYTNNASRLNNQPWLQFDGNDTLAHGGPTVFTQPNTYYVVASISSGTFAYILDGTNASTRNIIFISGTAWVMNLFAGTTRSGPANGITNNFYLLECEFHSAAAACEIITNGVSYFSAASPGVQSMSGAQIGRSSSGGSAWRGGIAEIIMYNSDVAAGDRTALRKYFTDKYGAFASW